MNGEDMRKFLLSVGASLLASVIVAGPALAHVTVQPSEAISGSFARFVVRVPNERDDASTVKVQVKFPPLTFVSFEDAPGWNRQVKMVEFDEPVDAFGEQVTEGVGSVTWSGGKIQPNEFAEFGFSARMPEGEEELEFPAIQTYSGGEVVRWVGPADAEEPAPLVDTVELGEVAEEGAGEFGVLHEVVHQLDALTTRVNKLGAESRGPDDVSTAAAASDNDAGDDVDNTGVILGSIGIVLGAIALVLALFRRRA
jgi:uncharacterized protein YcnI